MIPRDGSARATKDEKIYTCTQKIYNSFFFFFVVIVVRRLRRQQCVFEASERISVGVWSLCLPAVVFEIPSAADRSGCSSCPRVGHSSVSQVQSRLIIVISCVSVTSCDQITPRWAPWREARRGEGIHTSDAPVFLFSSAIFRGSKYIFVWISARREAVYLLYVALARLHCTRL